jgi:hypothetical protein
MDIKLVPEFFDVKVTCSTCPEGEENVRSVWVIGFEICSDPLLHQLQEQHLNIYSEVRNIWWVNIGSVQNNKNFKGNLALLPVAHQFLL